MDHRKLIEIDGRVSYQGGINMVDGWSSWHDMMVRAEGPVAAEPPDDDVPESSPLRDSGGTGPGPDDLD